MDPFLWSAYEALCDLGTNIDAARFFGPPTCFDNGGLRSVSRSLPPAAAEIIDQVVDVDMSPIRSC